MNYRHIYHAGNFTDVFKHIIQIALIQALQQKSSAYCFLDTHAGIGLYHLQAEAALKTQEANTGIYKIIHANQPPTLVNDYLNAVQAINQKFSADQDLLRYYPGSPLIANYFARKQDKLIACELHPDDYQALKNLFAKNTASSIHHMNGYHALKAFLPPKERRGLIFIDPPYEQANEWESLCHYLQIALKHFSNGIYAIWYPYKDEREVKIWQQQCRKLTNATLLIAEIMICASTPQLLSGCGMMIINPPWQLEITLQPVLAWLTNTLKINEKGCYRLKFDQ